MWESIKNKFRRKKHVEEEPVQESVVSEEKQSVEVENTLNEEYGQPESNAVETVYHNEKTDNTDSEISRAATYTDVHMESEIDENKGSDTAHVQGMVENTVEPQKSDNIVTEDIVTDDTSDKDADAGDIRSGNDNSEAKVEVEEQKEKPDNEHEPDLLSELDEIEPEQKQEEIESESEKLEDEVDISEEKEETKPKKTKKRGFFGKLIDGLTKTRDSFVSGLESVFSGFSEIDDDFYEELEEVLIMADIGVVTTEKIIENLKEKVKENKIKEVAVCRQLLIDSIKEQMRVHDDAYDFENKKSVVMLIGVNGVGKTTSVGKLASQFKADGKKVILAAADTFRAAAIEQLTEWSNRAGVELIAGQEGGDPAAVVYDAVNAAKARNADILICDTAGRLHNKKNLMEELKKINRIVEREYPDAYRETFVVLDGTTGQNALAQAKQFSQVADITGIILTKLDGTAKGGIAIAIQSEMNIPVKYIGIGEHIEDLQKFDADAFVDALFESKPE